jgi:hypothetical protein
MKRTEFTQPWLDALGSGEYKQGQHALECDSAYCCLGVAAKLMGAGFDDTFENYDAISTLLGMSKEERGKLITYNDGDGLTFHEIADEIEKMLEPAE